MTCASTLVSVSLISSGCLLLACGSPSPEASTAEGNDSMEEGSGASGDGDSGQGDGPVAAEVGDTNIALEPLPEPDPQPESCISADIQTERVIPTVMLLLDRSGSMDSGLMDASVPGYDPSRWNALKHLLLDPTTGVVPPLEDTVRFGLSLYTTGQFTCPRLSEVPPALGMYETMAATMRWDDAGGGTPTPEAVIKVSEAMDRLDLEGPKVLVLATDGTPSSCELSDPEASTITAVEAAYDSGITTFVINVGDGVASDDQEFLRDVAAAGQGHDPSYRPMTGDLFYGAGDATALQNAFEEIIFGSLICEFELEEEVTAGLEHTGTIELDGEALTYQNQTRGWQMKTPSTIELLGTACDDFLRQEGSLNVDFPCEAYPAVVR